MKKMSLLLIVLVAILFSGCATQQATNSMIAQSNTDRFKAFSEGMVGCGDNAACQVGLVSVFAGGLGQQQFFKEDSGVDYLRAGLPYADLGARIFTSWFGGRGSGDSAGLSIIGDNNQISGTANKLTADNQSSVSGMFTSTPTINHQAYTLTDDAAISTTTELAPEPVEEEVQE